MLADKEVFDELMIVLAPRVFDQCVEQRIDESEDKFAFVNAVGRRTAFLAKQLVVERNRIFRNGIGGIAGNRDDG